MQLTSDVSSNDSLDLDNLALPDNHRPPLELILVLLDGLREGVKAGLSRGREDEVVGDDGGEFGEPEEREGGKEFALGGNGLQILSGNGGGRGR